MYLTYWGLHKHAFHNVPDPKMYFKKHESLESSVHEVCFAIEDGDECLAVIIGEAGLGKTLILRMLFNTLDENKYTTALVINPEVPFPQLLREILTQLSGETCSIQEKEKLLEKFREILVENNQNKKKVVILIDEGSVLSNENLEGLRLLTNLQDDDRNLFTIVLAGQPQLAEILEHPNMTNLFQRIGVYCKLEKLESREVIKEYIQFRLAQAGCTNNVFTEEAIDCIWNYSGNGVPRLVNRLCKLALNTGASNQLGKIDANLIESIGKRFAGTAIIDNTQKPNQDFEILAKKTQHSEIAESIVASESKTEKTGQTWINIPKVDQNRSVETQVQDENKPKQVLTVPTQNKDDEIKPKKNSVIISEKILVGIKTIADNEKKIRIEKTEVVEEKWEGTKVFKKVKPAIVITPLEKPPEAEPSILQKPKSIKSEIDEMEEERNREIIHRMRDRHSQRVGGFRR